MEAAGRARATVAARAVWNGTSSPSAGEAHRPDNGRRQVSLQPAWNPCGNGWPRICAMGCGVRTHARGAAVCEDPGQALSNRPLRRG
eukprot:13732331-Alexandrium_andersonii.AAC.1